MFLTWLTVLKGMRLRHRRCIMDTRGETMRKLKVLGVLALLGGLLTTLTPQVSASMFKKHHHHHGPQHQKARPK
jgi:hypothetical protein